MTVADSDGRPLLRTDTFDIYEAVLLRVLGKEQGGLGLGIRSFFGIEKGSTFDPVRMSAVTSRFLAGAAAGAT